MKEVPACPDISEYEITRILTLVDAMADRMGIDEARDPEIAELAQDVAPEVVLKEMEERAQERAEQNAKERASGGPAPETTP